MTGAQAMRTPVPDRPRRNSKMPRTGAANMAMEAAHQTMAAPASPCMPSDGAKNLHGTPFACIYRSALAWAGHPFGAQGQAALVRTLFTVTR